MVPSDIMLHNKINHAISQVNRITIMFLTYSCDLDIRMKSVGFSVISEPVSIRYIVLPNRPSHPTDVFLKHRLSLVKWTILRGPR